MKQLRLQLQVMQHLYLWVILWKVQTISAQFRATSRGRDILSRAPPSYFSIDANGNYKYSYDSGTGFQGEQSASADNEVTGHYSYFENGVPYTVNYKSGVQGYRPELIPGSSGPHVTTQFSRFGNGDASNVITASPSATQTSPPAMQAPPAIQATSFTTRTLEPPTRELVIPLLNAMTPQQLRDSEENLTSKRFVQDAMKMMRSSPVQLSFASQQGLLQHRQQTQQQQQQIVETQQQIMQHIPQQPMLQTLPQQQQIHQQLQSSIQQLQHQLPTIQQQQIIASPITQQQNMQQMPHSLQQQEPQEEQQPYTFSYFADQSAHMQTADQNGNVLGKYAYYDQNGFHDLTYQAGGDAGFVVLGGNLAKPTTATQQPQVFVNVARTPTHGSYNYSILPRLSTASSTMKRQQRKK